MADHGVIALDPARLSGLEVYLQGLGDGCRRRAGRVADACAGTDVGADQPVAELERLGHVCHRERDEVAWRRALVEALPDDLPLPPRLHVTADAARLAARDLAAEVRAAVAAHPPYWRQLAGLLAELDRSATSPTFTTAFLAALGPDRARQLPLVLERAWRRGWEAPPGADGRPVDRLPTEAEAGVVLAAQQRLAVVVRTASQARRPDALDERWWRAYAGLPLDDRAVAAAEEAATASERRAVDEVERTLHEAGYGLGVAATVARAVGWRRAAAALTVDRGLIGLVAAPRALLDGDGPVCDGAEVLVGVAAAGVTIVGAVVPGAALPAALASGLLGGLAVLASSCERQPARPAETRPTVDPVTGQARLPSGHQSNPHVDVAGVPLPPSYG